jgi:hypothetical protein
MFAALPADHKLSDQLKFGPGGYYRNAQDMLFNTFMQYVQ